MLLAMKRGWWLVSLLVICLVSFMEASALHKVGFPVSRATVGDIWTKTAADGRVTQWVEVLAPSKVDLTFRYCDAMTCGTTENYECVADKWIPQFADLLPRSLTIPALPGSRAQKIFIKAGPAPGIIATGDYFEPDDQNFNEFVLSSAPAIGQDGSVTINFGTGYTPRLGQALADLPRQGNQVCGLTEEQYKGFRSTFGTSYDNSYRQYYKIAIVWSPPTSCCTATKPIILDGHEYNDLIGWSQPGQRVATQHFQQTDRQWTNQLISGQEFGRVGTVPTAIAAALSGLGSSLTPPEVGQEMTKQGVWQPGTGSDWVKLQQYLKSKGYAVQEVTLFSAKDGAGGNSQFVATYEREKNKSATVVLTGYEPSSNQFTALDPTRGQINLSWSELAGGNPWILQISRP